MEDKKRMEIFSKPRGPVPMCHGLPMQWSKYGDEWRCVSQMIHTADAMFNAYRESVDRRAGG